MMSLMQDAEHLTRVKGMLAAEKRIALELRDQFTLEPLKAAATSLAFVAEGMESIYLRVDLNSDQRKPLRTVELDVLEQNIKFILTAWRQSLQRLLNVLGGGAGGIATVDYPISSLLGWDAYCPECNEFRKVRRARNRVKLNCTECSEFVCTLCYTILLTFKRAETPEMRE